MFNLKSFVCVGGRGGGREGVCVGGGGGERIVVVVR